MWYEIISLPIYYWSRDAKDRNAEIYYLMIFDGMIYPIEIKDGPLRLLNVRCICKTANPLANDGKGVRNHFCI